MDGTFPSGDTIACESLDSFGACIDPRELRREERRRSLETMRGTSVEAGIHLNDAMAGRVEPDKRPLFGQMADPVSSLADLNRSVIQLVLCEERLDETDEERIARIKAEGEAKARADQRAADRREHAQSRACRSEHRGQVRFAVSEITLAKLHPVLRSRNLDKFLADLDRDKAAFDRDPAQLVAEIISRLGLAPILTQEDKAHFEKRREDLFTGARDHLDALWPKTTAQAQGPP
jgi:hypothetical protein